MTKHVLTPNVSRTISEKSNQLRVMSLIAQSGYVGELPEEDLWFLFSLYHDICTQIVTLSTHPEIEVTT